MKVELLNKSDYGKLEKFLLEIPNSLVYYSTIYKDFLENFIEASSAYFIVKDGEKIMALLPSFLKKNSQYGNVLNSSPFYGSNGGVISAKPSNDISHSLYNAFDIYAKENKCISSTIITSPFESNIKWYDDNIDFTFKDERVGQLTRLPQTQNRVMDIYHSKTRNTVRKALLGLDRIDYKNGLEYLDFISETHKENLVAINGLYKPRSFFEKIIKTFKYGENLRIYIGFNKNNEPISGLLNLYYNKTVEYFTPVTLSAFRDTQPLSGIIYQAMQDAVEEGYEWWNWGGTWLSQGGVYQFKSRWGTTDFPYFYYTKVYDQNILNLSPEILTKEFPNFFVVPFKDLNPI